MTIRSRVQYYMQCDECGRTGKLTGAVSFENTSQVEYIAQTHGWLTEKGTHKCPPCIKAAYVYLLKKAEDTWKNL